MHETNLGPSRATLDTCARACESAARAQAGRRNAPRARTMPSPVTYVSSCIAWPLLVVPKPLRLHSYSF